MIFKTEWGWIGCKKNGGYWVGFGYPLGTNSVPWPTRSSLSKTFFFFNCLNNILRRPQSTFHSPAPLKRSSTKVIQCQFIDFLNNIFVFRNEVSAVGLWKKHIKSGLCPSNSEGKWVLVSFPKFPLLRLRWDEMSVSLTPRWVHQPMAGKARTFHER